jgi:basic membrane protein A and related proteins
MFAHTLHPFLAKLPNILLTTILSISMISSCAPATIDCSREDTFCVGLVTSNMGKVSDGSFNQSAWEAVQEAKKQFRAEVHYIETVNARDYAKNIAAFGEEKYDVIVTVGGALTDATRNAAELYPNTDFVAIDQFQEEPVNGVAGLIFPEDHAGFLAGALAAMMSDSHQIGAVCASDGIPSVWRMGEGYKAGAAYVDELRESATIVFVIYNDSFNESFIQPEWGAETASAMMAQGADVIFGCGGRTGDGALVAAAQENAYVIGVDTDQYWTLPEASSHMISSVIKLVPAGVFELIQLSYEGKFPGGDYMGHVGYAPFHDLDHEIPPDVKEQLEAIRTGLTDGSIETNVPSQKP